MASAAFPALAINTQGESPLNTLAKVEQLKTSMQSQELGQIQLTQARLQQQSQQAIMKAWTDNNGDPDKTLQAVVQSGKALPNDVTALQAHFVDLKTKAAILSEDQLKVQTEQNGIVYNELKSFQSLPVEQRTPDKVQGIMANLAKQNVPIDRYIPYFQQIAKDPSDVTLKPIETGLVGQKKVLEDEAAFRQEASAPTVGQAQQKTALELQKLSAEAQNAQRLFENQPTPIQANTKREADLRLVNAETAKAYAETAKTKFDMFMKQNEPVEGTNADNVRVVVPRAQSKGLTSVNELSATDYDKLSMLSARFGQVAQNYGKLEAAIRQSGQIQHRDDMAQVIADQGLGDEAGFLHAIPSGKMLASKEVSKATADSWNKLTPEERNLAMAYLQVKGGIITYNKAVDDTGRANETALHLEGANIPTPLEDKGVALTRIAGNKDNLRAILPAIPHFSHLPDPLQYLQAGENVPITSPAQQPRNTNAFGYQPPPVQR